MTLQFCTQFVDEWQVADEEAIAAALVGLLEHEHKLVEGAAAVSVAVAMREAHRFPGANLAVVLCGSNISFSTVKELLAK